MLLFLVPVFAAPEELPFKLKCEYLTYDRENEIAFSSGSVLIEREGLTMQADEATYNRRDNSVFLSGNVKIKDSTATVTCSSADYSITSDTARLQGVRVFQDPFYIAGKNATKSGDFFYFSKAHITTCDLIPPHYKVSSSRLKLKRNDWMSMTNVCLSFHGVPALYLPYYWQTIGEKKWDISVRAGRSRRKGNFANTRFTWRFTKDFKTILINDYFSELGYGKGLELDLEKPDVQSNLYAYHIDEKDTGIRNLTFRQKHWQKLPGGFIWQSDLDYQDNSMFNYDYMRESVSVLKPTYLRSRASLSRASPLYYFRLSGYRNEIWRDTDGDGIDDKFEPDNVIAPEAYFRLNPRNLKLFRYDLSYNYRNYFNTDPSAGTLYGEYTRIHSSEMRVFDSYRLLRGLTLFPRFGYSLYKEQPQASMNYYFHDINLNVNFYRPLKFGFTHNYRREFGEKAETINIAISDEYRPLRNVVFKQSTVYDLKKSSWSVKNRFSTLTNNLSINMRKVSFYFRNYFNIQNTETTSWEGEAYNRFFSTRLTHESASPDFVNLFQTFNFTLGKWSASVRGRFYFNYDDFKFKSDSLIEKEFSIKKNIHCWDMLVKYLVTPDRCEAWVFFNVAAFPNKPLGVFRDAEADEWSFRKK
ncbi:MAG: hypothetical protein ABIJ15_07020 [bacterium]